MSFLIGCLHILSILFIVYGCIILAAGSGTFAQQRPPFLFFPHRVFRWR